MTTLIDSDDDVVYRVALCEHPLIAGPDDDRTDEELIAAIEERTETADDIEWPDWMVEVVPAEGNHPRVRIVNTASRINVLAPYEGEPDPFEAIVERVEIKDWSVEDAAMSCPSPTHPDDFDREIHLDVTG